jgi:hypothetical protein
LRAPIGSREVVALRALGTVSDELGWFFSVDDGRRVRPQLNKASESQLAALLRVPKEVLASQSGQERVHRRIRRWLVAIREHDIAVLQAAYGPRAWPRALCRELGVFTGIVVRLASAVEWPSETWEQDKLEIRVATRLDAAFAKGGPEVFAVFRTAAAHLLNHALGAYVAVRGQTTAIGGVRL